MYRTAEYFSVQCTLYRTEEFCSVQCTGMQGTVVYSVQDCRVLQYTVCRTAEYCSIQCAGLQSTGLTFSDWAFWHCTVVIYWPCCHLMDLLYLLKLLSFIDTAVISCHRLNLLALLSSSHTVVIYCRFSVFNWDCYHLLTLMFYTDTVVINWNFVISQHYYGLPAELSSTDTLYTIYWQCFYLLTLVSFSDTAVIYRH